MTVQVVEVKEIDEDRRAKRREACRRWAKNNQEYNRSRQKKYSAAQLAKVKESRKIDPQKFRDRANAYNAKNRDRVQELERVRYRKNSKTLNEKGKAWRHANPELSREIVKNWRKNNAAKHAKTVKEWSLKANYGISLAQRDAMFAAQGYRCAICASTTTGWTKDWHVDHCHKTGLVRGVLCHPCNMTLGTAKDNPSTLRKAADYLEACAARAVVAEVA